MRNFFLFAVVLTLSACEGVIVGARGSPIELPGARPDCATRGQGSAPRLRLLWRSAYLAEVSARLGPGAATAAQAVGLSPATDKQFNFETAGSLMTDASLASLAATADAIAVWALSSDQNATAVFGCNARAVTGAEAEACFTAFLRRTGPRLQRRPMSAAQVDETLAFFRAQALEGQSDGTQEGFRMGLASLLMHPDFLYVHDVGDPQAPALDAFSVASRVAFALTGQGPDDALFAAADDGSLLSPGVLEAQVERLLRTPEARVRSLAFFRQWLRYDGWSTAYSPAFLSGLDVTTVRADAVAELDGFVSEQLWAAQANPAALLTSRGTGGLTPTLAQLYGASAGDTTLPANRAGLLTRVGLLASGTDDWHVVARGLTVVQKLLCRDMTPPNINLADAAKQAEQLRVSNADRIAAVTAAPACAGCHRTINPLGSARSDFDAVGRAVTVEKHYAGGVFDFEVPVVSSADLTVPLGRAAQVDGSVALSGFIAESPEYAQCFATQFVRAAMGRADASDACLAADATTALAQGGSMLDAMRAAMTSPDFLLFRE